MQMQRPRPEDYSLKETSPHLGGVMAAGDKLTSTYDLVEQMQYLYVRVVKAKDLPAKDVTGSCDPYVAIKLGNCKGTTRHFEKNTNPKWNQVFAFSKERIQSSYVEVIVKDKDFIKDDFIQRVVFDLNEVPKRVPPDSPLAPQWYRLEDRKGGKVKGELMLAVWIGTQADEAFPEAWHSEVATVPSDGLASIRSKVYLTPKLWYLRVNVIEAQDLVPSDKSWYREVYVKATLGNQFQRTRISPNKTVNSMWNEDLMFVAAEPFEEHLILSVEYWIAHNKDEVLGKAIIQLQSVDRRLDHRPVHRRWYNIETHVVVNGEQKKKDVKFSSRIHVRICLEGGYRVLDESTHYSSDLRATAKQLWKPSTGVLELGILNAQGLLPMKTKDGRGTTYSYCVAKYGHKWVRTRTIIDSFNPKWNEQYTWDVYDPCTVVTIGVFHGCHGVVKASPRHPGGAEWTPQSLASPWPSPTAPPRRPLPQVLHLPPPLPPSSSPSLPRPAATPAFPPPFIASTRRHSLLLSLLCHHSLLRAAIPSRRAATPMLPLPAPPVPPAVLPLSCFLPCRPPSLPPALPPRRLSPSRAPVLPPSLSCSHVASTPAASPSGLCFSLPPAASPSGLCFSLSLSASPSLPPLPPLASASLSVPLLLPSAVLLLLPSVLCSELLSNDFGTLPM